jgi:hypothetical protein
MGLGKRGRRLPVARVLIAFPVISGLFFAALSTALVLPIGGAGRATEVGMLVGGIMFTANAAALCIVQSSAWDVEPRARPSEIEPVNEARAS